MVTGLTSRIGFCFTRIMATSLRIAWSCYPKSVKLGIAAMVFVYAGIILLFIGNLFFSQRIVRAQHPHFGWTKPFSIALPVILVIIIASILTLIVGVLISFYTLNTKTLTAVRDIQLYGETLYAVVSFPPIPIVTISSLMRRKPSIRDTQTIDKFGYGSMRAKIALVLISATFLCTGASWRAATLYLPQESTTSTKTPWYFSKVCFYLFNFSIEISVVYFWLIMRIDKRFFIPNGAKGPFSYGGGYTFAGEPGNEKNQLGNRDSMRHLTGSTASGIGGSSRVSWGGSRNSMARESRVSWGGISREDVTQGMGEDGLEIMPYPVFDDEHDASSADVGIDGAEAEMGWDAKTGKVRLFVSLGSNDRTDRRTVGSATSLQRGSTLETRQYEAYEHEIRSLDMCRSIFP